MLNAESWDIFSSISWLAVLEWILRIVAVFIIPRKRTDAAARAWLLLVFFMPSIGWPMFLAFGSARLPKWRRERRLAYRVSVEQRAKTLMHSDVLRTLPVKSASIAAVAEKLVQQPVLGQNSLQLISNYDAAISSLVQEIDSAERHVHLLYYIFYDDTAGGQVAQALIRAVKRGVRCRVLIDALGSLGSRKQLIPLLKNHGIDIRAVFRIADLRRMARIDLRNHRKIAVIDGRVGFTGSQNLVSSDFKPGFVYEEMVVRIEGLAVRSLQLVFASDWFAETNENLMEDTYFPLVTAQGLSNAQVLPSDAGSSTPPLQRLMILMLGLANERVVMTTPYFIPDESMLQAMELAILRGVEVHLVVSKDIDQFFVGYAQRSYYEQLLSIGVTIHQYHRAFLHAKHFSIDDFCCGVGSSNMDIRSFKINAEVTLLIYDKAIIRSLHDEQNRYFAGSELININTWRHRPRLAKWFEGIARLISPVL